MKKFRKVVKWIFIVLTCAFVIVQFWRPARTNPAIDPAQTMQAQLQVPPHVAGILERSCQDCHSNATRWPWYTNVTPVSWFVVDHVDHGRSHLNFSEWGSLQPHEKEKKLQEICEQVEVGAMPLNTYTPLHPGSALSPEDVKALCDWANAERARIAEQPTK
ncbi:MAG: heme-binding domain-containing protein [Pyrinomonadaceae bacterium]|nr:heme-binding domain-containing protein [Pyrinomonadaceae bacterium]